MDFVNDFVVLDATLLL